MTEITKADLDQMEKHIVREIDNVKESVDRNTRALRGGNGDGGLIGRIIKIETTCMARGTASQIEHANLAEKNVDWIQITKGIILPVSVSILGSIVTAIILIRVLALN